MQGGAIEVSMHGTSHVGPDRAVFRQSTTTVGVAARHQDPLHGTSELLGMHALPAHDPASNT